MDLYFYNATGDDFDFVYEAICNLENYKLDKESFMEIFKKNVSNKDIIYLILKDSNMNKAFISIHVQYLLHHSDRVAEIQEFWVDEKKRSLGYGKEIIKKIVDILKEKGINYLEVSTNKKREGAQKFYKNQGFIESHYKYTMRI